MERMNAKCCVGLLALVLFSSACSDGQEEPRKVRRRPQPQGQASPAAAAPVVQDGVEIVWYGEPNKSQKRSEGLRQAGKREGAWTWWTEQGKLAVTGQFQNDEETGVWIEYYPTQTKKREDHWENGRKQGPSIEYFESGQKKQEVQFAGGLQEGPFQAWHPDGKLATQGSARAGKFEGEIREWYPNGQLKQQASFAEGVQTGLQERWYETGQLESSTQFQNGAPHGEARSFYPDGKLRFEGAFDQNRRTGEWRCFKPDGSPDAQASGLYEAGARKAALPAEAKLSDEHARRLGPVPRRTAHRPGRMGRDRCRAKPPRNAA
jgi:antitoxin component YwqK of YwqJK toxin-antitoxin module